MSQIIVLWLSHRVRPLLFHKLSAKSRNRRIPPRGDVAQMQPRRSNACDIVVRAFRIQWILIHTKIVL